MNECQDGLEEEIHYELLMKSLNFAETEDYCQNQTAQPILATRNHIIALYTLPTFKFYQLPH